jgi:hypothetical protein
MSKASKIVNVTWETPEITALAPDEISTVLKNDSLPCWWVFISEYEKIDVSTIAVSIIDPYHAVIRLADSNDEQALFSNDVNFVVVAMATPIENWVAIMRVENIQKSCRNKSETVGITALARITIMNVVLISDAS